MKVTLTTAGIGAMEGNSATWFCLLLAGVGAVAFSLWSAYSADKKPTI